MRILTCFLLMGCTSNVPNNYPGGYFCHGFLGKNTGFTANGTVNVWDMKVKGFDCSKVCSIEEPDEMRDHVCFREAAYQWRIDSGAHLQIQLPGCDRQCHSPTIKEGFPQNMLNSFPEVIGPLNILGMQPNEFTILEE